MERKEAIQIIKNNWPSDRHMLSEALKFLIPELKESEDERIRKWLICYFKDVCDNVSEKEKKCVLAWLEKKGEQKPAWSEEDEKEVTILEAYICSKDWSDRHIDRALGIVYKLVNKVKSLRPQKQWKPSDEQIKAMTDAGYTFDSENKELKEIEQTDWNKEDEKKLLLLKALCDDQINSSTPGSTMYREMQELKDWLNGLLEQFK